MAGPTMDANCQAEVLQEIALGSASRGTKVGISACVAGLENERAKPSKIVMP